MVRISLARHRSHPSTLAVTTEALSWKRRPSRWAARARPARDSECISPWQASRPLRIGRKHNHASSSPNTRECRESFFYRFLRNNFPENLLQEHDSGVPLHIAIFDPRCLEAANHGVPFHVTSVSYADVDLHLRQYHREQITCTSSETHRHLLLFRHGDVDTNFVTAARTQVLSDSFRTVRPPPSARMRRPPRPSVVMRSSAKPDPVTGPGSVVPVCW